MLRTGILLVALAAVAAAQDSARDAYKQAKKLRGSKKREYSGEQAEAFAGTAEAKNQLYVGYLFTYAEEWSKAADAFGAYLSGTPSSKNRANGMLQRATCLLKAGRPGDVGPVIKDFETEFASHKYLGRMRFCEGRALRAAGNAEGALAAFRKAAIAGDDNAKYEVIDCLLQLGKYDEAAAATPDLDNGSSRFAVYRAAQPALGKPLPKKLPYDFWTGKELAAAEVTSKPTVFTFWSTKGGKSRRLIHELGNEWAAAHGDKINVVGPGVYLQFDPIAMKTSDEVTKEAEQGFVTDWADQYVVKYPLVLMGDGSLHTLVGLDPEKPYLPAFAITDKQGILRYIRIGPSDWEIEAVEAMVKRIAAE